MVKRYIHHGEDTAAADPSPRKEHIVFLKGELLFLKKASMIDCVSCPLDSPNIHLAGCGGRGRGGDNGGPRCSFRQEGSAAAVSSPW